LKNDQASSLRRRLEAAQHPKEGKTLSIISGKGGVGKSNIALSFSLELINQQKKVLLIDLDVGMGNIDVLLGLHTKKTIFDMFEESLSIHDIIETGPQDLAYIAAGSGLRDFFSLDKEKKHFFLEQYKELIALYDYIIFDFGAGISEESMFFMLSSDECIVVTTPETTSIMDAYSIIKHLVNQRGELLVRVIMNRVEFQKQGLDTFVRLRQVIQQFLHIDIELMGMLPEDKSVKEAVQKQIPYLLWGKKSRISKATRAFTFNYLTNKQKVNNVKPLSFVQKLKSWIAEGQK